MSFPSEEAPAPPPYARPVPPRTQRVAGLLLDRLRSSRRRWSTAAVVAGAIAVVGLGIGLLWRALAPRVTVVRIQAGFEYVGQPEQAMAAEGWFAFLGLVAGVVFALVAWVVLRRQRGLAVLVGLVLGSLVGAWLAWWFPLWLQQGDFEALASAAQVGTRLDLPLSLRVTDLDADRLWPPKVTGVVLVQALGAAIAYTTLAGFAADPDLRPVSARTDYLVDAVPGESGRPETDRSPSRHTEISSGPGGPAGPPGWPVPPGSA